MVEKRSELVGTMSEICARGRILIARLMGRGRPISCEDAEILMLNLEREMRECSEEFERTLAR